MPRFRMLWRNRARILPLLQAARPTFSQFGEDLAISILLRPQGKGTYVDVGANHPIKGSNTAYLYMLGWSGLAIDPNPIFAPEFRKIRPRDTHLTNGVAERDCDLTYYEFSQPGLNTFSTPRAEQLASEGNAPILTRRIPCRPLKTLIGEHMPGQRIDLLSIDCEGLDLQVLKSADLGQLQPTVLVVEDFMQYVEFRDRGPVSDFDRYLRSMGYSPIFQCAWSSIYVANDWRCLPKTGAFSPPQNLQDYMPKPLR